MRKISDQLDNKDAEPKISKTAHSANVRNGRIMQARSMARGDCSNKNHCDKCGFRIRSIGHLEGAHHNGIAVPCHRGR